MSKKTVIATVAGVAGALAFGVAQANSNPFAMQDLGQGYQVAQKHAKEAGDKKKDGKCGEAKCGGDKKKDGKCGEGKCGGDKKK